MCEAVILSRCSRKNLYVPNMGNNASFRSENKLFRSKTSDILALFSNTKKMEDDTQVTKPDPIVS